MDPGVPLSVSGMTAMTVWLRLDEKPLAFSV